jgi:hypothetical protein
MIDMRAANILPTALVYSQKMVLASGDIFQFSYAEHGDLNAAGGGYDFLLQASNAVSAEVAFASLKLPWVMGRIDAQGAAALRGGGQVPLSSALQALIAPQASLADANADVVVLLSLKDVLFDSQTTCRVRADVRVALGKVGVVPREPPLGHTPTLGETVEGVIREFIQTAVVAELQQRDEVSKTASVAGRHESPPTLRTASGTLFDQDFVSQGSRPIATLLPNRVNLGGRQWIDVNAWLGGGVLEISAEFSASGNQAAATIRVSADVSASTANYTELASDAALLLSTDDPIGLVAMTTSKVRERGQIALLDEISLVAGPNTARVNNLAHLSPQAFPCGQGACPLSVGATIVFWHVGAPTSIRFVGQSGYGVLWSAEAVALLVNFCWENNYFPRVLPQAGPITLTINGSDQVATAEADIKLETLKTVALEYDSNGRTDMLHLGGNAQIIPRRFRLADGQVLLPANPSDPLFAPGEVRPWNAIATLIESQPTGASADIVQFERQVTGGTTSRLGRPFTERSGTVSYSRISAFSQRILLLAE